MGMRANMVARIFVVRIDAILKIRILMTIVMTAILTIMVIVK